MGRKCLRIESLGHACLKMLALFPRAAYGDSDVRYGGLINDAQFLARSAIDILRHVSVGELYPDRVVRMVLCAHVF